MTSRRQPRNAPPRHAAGVVLLETLLAVTLFVTTAAVVLGAVNASIRAQGDLALNATAMDRAVSVFSRLRMGILPLADAGPAPCDPPFDHWTYQITTTPSDTADADAALLRVQITVRNDDHQYQQSLTELFAQPASATQGGAP